MSKPSKADILSRRMDRVEETSADLERCAENWTLQGRTLWDIRVQRIELRSAARRYAAAVRALARSMR